MMTINYSAAGRTVRTEAQKKAHAERMKAFRAKAKSETALAALAESNASLLAKADVPNIKAPSKAKVSKAQAHADAIAKQMEGQTAALKASKPAFETAVLAAKAKAVGFDGFTGEIADGRKEATAKALEALAKPDAVKIPDVAKPLDIAAPKSGVCVSAACARAEARATYGDAPYTIKKTARGDWFWGPAESETAKEAKPVKSKPEPKAKLEKAAKSEPKAPKSAKAPKASGGDKTPRPGTDAEVILRQLTGDKGMTRESIEAELKALRGKPVKIAPRSTALRFGESYGYRLTERKDSAADGGQDRFFLVRAVN